MKIAFRISTLKFGGAERVFISVADYLKTRNDVDVQFVVDSSVSGGTEEVVKRHGFKIFNLNCHRTVKSIIPFKRYIDDQRPDIVISAYTDTNFAALISARLARHRCITVVSEHASLDEHWQHASVKRRLLLNAYVRFGYRWADHVLAVSKGIAEQLLSRLNKPGRVSFIYNPVRFPVPSGSRPSAVASDGGPRTILAVGRIARQKDYLSLLRALQVVAKKTAVRLVIVGGVHEQAEKDKLDQFIHTNELSNLVEFVGFTEHVEKYYQSADLFVLSSAWEGFGNVLVEALAFGLPVISTNCKHGPAEILCNGQYGRLVPVADWAALADAISSALDAPPPDKVSLQRRSEEFSEERIGARYWELFERLRAEK